MHSRPKFVVIQSKNFLELKKVLLLQFSLFVRDLEGFYTDLRERTTVSDLTAQQDCFGFSKIFDYFNVLNTILSPSTAEMAGLS